jgi:hypothetical protein
MLEMIILEFQKQIYVEISITGDAVVNKSNMNFEKDL